MFDEGVLVDEVFELVFGDKVVVYSMFFALTWLPGCVRNTEPKLVWIFCK